MEQTQRLRKALTSVPGQVVKTHDPAPPQAQMIDLSNVVLDRFS
jgi:hypothetical protein